MGEQSRAERLFRLMDKDGDGYVTKSVKYFYMILLILIIDGQGWGWICHQIGEIFLNDITYFDY